jgi:exosortase
MKKLVIETVSNRPGISSLWLMGLSLVMTAMMWNYWTTIIDLIKEWQRNPDYSAGGIVPFVAGYLIWVDRKKYRNCPLHPFWPAGLIILIAQAIRFYGLDTLQESMERYSLILTLGGLTLWLGGKVLFYQMRWVFLFLLLMVPFPGVIHNAISFPLQNLASMGAVYFLELGGVSVVREGNVLLLDDRFPIAVVEACSGLRLLTAFVIVSASLAYLMQRSPWQKGVLFLSCLPIAIFCNMARLAVTAVLYMKVNNRVADSFFHDFAGLTMMPMAILILLGEACLMKRLFKEKAVSRKHQWCE